MSQPTPTVFYIAVYQEDVPGPQHKVLTSISGLLRFIEGELRNEERNVGFGPFDVFVVDTKALECARYDIAPLLALSGRVPVKSKKKAGR